MKSPYITLVWLVLLVSFSSAQIPLNHLKMWLRADSVEQVNDSISIWYDLSGNNLHANQTNLQNRPLKKDSVINNLPSIEFNGLNNYLEANFGQDFSQPNTFIILWNIKGLANMLQVGYIGLNTGKTHATFWRNNNSININGGVYVNNVYSKSAPFDFIVSTTEFNGSNTNVYENGTLMNTVNGGTNVVDGISIGGKNGEAFWLNGNIAEIIFYDSLLIQSEREQVENYLIDKYAPPVDLGTDIIIPYTLCDTAITAANHPYNTNYLWSTGETTSTITVSETGTYTVTVTNIFGRISVDDIYIEYPSINIIGDTTFCLDDTIIWDTNLPNSYTFLWSEGSSDTLLSIYAENEYSVTITDSFGCSVILDTIFAQIDSFPAYNALIDTIDICDGTAFGLSYSLQNISSYYWNTGSTDSICTVSGGGEYTIELENTAGCRLYDTTYINIIGTAPIVDFTYDTVCFGDTTTFTDLSTPAAGIISWYWEFGDTYTSNQQNITHLYSICDTFIVSLAVQTANCSNKISKLVPIKPIPHSEFTTEWGNQIYCVNTDIGFNNLSWASGTQSITYDWDFGNSGSSNDFEPVYQYSNTGNYSIELIVHQSNGCSDTSYINIEVDAGLPIVNNLDLIQPNQNAVFSVIDQINYSWNIAEHTDYYNLIIASDPGFNNIIQTLDSLTQELVTLTAPQNYDTVYWKVEAINACDIITESTQRFYSIFIPEADDSLKLWCSADSAEIIDNKVATWYDLSGNNFHAIQSDTAYRPLIIKDTMVNLLPVLNFDGSNDYLETSFGNSFSQPNTYIIIWNITEPTNSVQIPYTGLINGKRNSTFWRNSNFISLNGGSYVSEAYSKNMPYIYIISTTIFDGTSTKVYENGNLMNILSAGNDSVTGLYFGGIPSENYWLDGNIAEIIYYDTALTDVKRNLIELYLMNKYAPPVNLGPDIYIKDNFCDTLLIAGERFTDYLWSEGSINSTLTINNTGSYSVTVTDIFGRISVDTVNVYYNLPFVLGDTTICLGDTIEWNTGFDNSTYDFIWSTGSFDSLIFISDEINYSVTVTDLFGCSFESNISNVQVDSFSYHATLGPDTIICGGSQITIQNETGTVYNWSTGETTQYITIDTTGLYSVVVINLTGCVMKDSVYYTVEGYAPTAIFTNNVTCSGDITNFTDMSFPNDGSSINSWNWDFGDNNTSTDQHPVHYFQNPGVYTVVMKIETDSGCMNIAIEDVQIYNLPVAGFSQTHLCIDNPVYFMDTSLSADGSVVNWEWDFGDSGQSGQQNPEHTYTGTGNYNVELIVETEYGCRDTILRQLSLLESPKSSFNAAETCYGDEVKFTDMSTTQPINPLLNWRWNFGDGTTSLDQSPVHAFTDTGYYDIELVVQSINGCFDTIITPIYINTRPEAYFTDSIACIGNTYQFTDSSKIDAGNITYWKWTIDGITLYEMQDPYHIFNMEGIHDIQLIVSSDSACTDTFEMANFYVSALPDAAFDFSPAYSIPYWDISYSVSPNTYTYLWEFGDGDTSAIANPVHMYQDSGTYNIDLIVTNSYGCQDSTMKQINVLEPNCDIAVYSVNYEINSGYMSVSALIGNMGNIPITEMELYIYLDNGYQIKETWTGMLNFGSFINYDFTGTYAIDQNNFPELICVMAYPVEFTDIDETNNEYCLVDESVFNLLDPHPNPTSENLYYEVILPKTGSISINVYDKKGKLVENKNVTGLAKGYNKLMLNLDEYLQGTYTIQVKYFDAYRAKQFVVKR